jgi:hypothetical protein
MHVCTIPVPSPGESELKGGKVEKENARDDLRWESVEISVVDIVHTRPQLLPLLQGVVQEIADLAFELFQFTARTTTRVNSWT